MSKVSKLITKNGTYSTTPSAKFISMPDYSKGEGHYKYIPKTKDNLQAIIKLKGKADVYVEGKTKRFIWW